MQTSGPNRVWVVNRNSHDYSNAEGYGTLASLSEGRVNIFAVDTVKKDVLQRLSSARRGDYILVSGYAIINAIAVHYFLKRFGLVRLLIFGANDRKYKCVTLTDMDF